ncbi:MAG: hypothetical protein FWH10_04300 [Oscillospiraceae bacterium]|nr:hypothetical protein [Oscillospiraceae bacterium]
MEKTKRIISRLTELSGVIPKSVIEILFVFALIFTRFVSYGFRYYYQLDDYIQYHLYASSENIPALIKQVGLLGARPIAGLSDIYIWSRFFGSMIFGVLIISLMYSVSAVLLKNIFAKYFNAGWFFIIFFTLLPLGIEGTYWMSASTRIVAGLFWASLSITFFQKYIESGKIRYIFIYSLTQLVSFGYYEQILVFSFTLTFLLAIINIIKSKSIKHTGFFTALISVFNAAVYFIFTNYFMSGLSMERTEIVLPKSEWYWDNFLPKILSQIFNVFITGNYKTSVRGFRRGLYYIFSDGLWIYAVSLIIILALLFIYLKKRDINNSNSTKKTGIILTAAFAVLLAAAPVTPFLFIGNPWFSFRGACASFAGIALLFDLILRGLCFGKKNIVLYSSVFLVFVFSIAGVSEIRDYKLTYEHDNLIISKISETVASDNISQGKRVGILNLKPSYLDEQNFEHHEHIHGVTESSWALSGALVSFDSLNSPNSNNSAGVPDVIPMPIQEDYDFDVAYPFYRGWNRNTMRISGFDFIYYLDDDFNLHRLIINPVEYEEHRYILYFDDGNGTLCAEVWEENELGYIMIYNIK